jgi:hypothetical protein
MEQTGKVLIADEMMGAGWKLMTQFDAENPQLL